jgi:hypothetical protein
MISQFTELSLLGFGTKGNSLKKRLLGYSYIYSSSNYYNAGLRMSTVGGISGLTSTFKITHALILDGDGGLRNWTFLDMNTTLCVQNACYSS